MNDQATLLKWAQQLPASPYGKEACAKLLEAVSQQRLALPAIHQAGLLQPLCVALRSKDAYAQQRAVAVLLEASRCGAGGEVELAAAPGCCQALLDLVATNMPVQSTVFEAGQQPLAHNSLETAGPGCGALEGVTSTVPPATAAGAAPLPTSTNESSNGAAGKAIYPQASQQLQLADRPPALNAWEDPHEAARAACSLLWRISTDSEGRELLMGGTSALVQVLMVLLGTPSSALRMAASGALFNLSQEPRVQSQLVNRAQELVPILMGLLARAGSDLQAAIAAYAAAGGNPWTCLSETASASGRASPDVSLAHPALLAAAAGGGGSGGGTRRNLGHTDWTNMYTPAGSRGSCGSGGAAWSSQPASPYGSAPTAATASSPEAVAATLMHVAGLLRVLCCNVSVAGTMAAQEGQFMGRLLRALAQTGIAAVTLCRHLPSPLQQHQSQQPPTPSQTPPPQPQPQPQSQPQQQQQVAPPPPLLDCLGRFQILCGGVVAALAAHAPLDAAVPASSSGVIPAASGVVATGPAVAHAFMSALYGYCCEADNAGIAVLAANPGVATALALSLSYGARVLGVEAHLAQAHPHLQPCPTTVAFGGGGAGNSIPDPSVRGGAGGGAATGAPVGAAAIALATSDSGCGGIGAAALGSLDPAGALGAAVYALHSMRVVAASSLATEALVAADCGALPILRTLSYFLIHRSMDQTTSLDEEAFAVQAIASGTLAKLAEQPAVRDMVVVQEALAPPPEVLSAMALLLMLPPAPPPPLVWGTAAGDSAAAASRSFVASLLAAIAQHGPYSYEMFTQVIVNTRGALGTIISLLPSPTATSTRGERESQQQLLTSAAASGDLGASIGSVLGLAARGSGSSPLAAGGGGASHASSGPLPAAGAVAGSGCPESAVVNGSGGGGVAGEPYDDAAAAGVEAALALCSVAAHSRDVARVLAGKTTLVPTLLAVLRERRPVLPVSASDSWSAAWQRQWQWQAGLRVKVLRLLCTLTMQLGESSVRTDLVADSGLVPALVHCLGLQQPPGVVAAALEWLSLLLQHPTFMQDRMQGPTANEFLGRVLELLQLLPHTGVTAAGALTPSRAASLATAISLCASSAKDGSSTPGSGGAGGGNTGGASLAAAAAAAAAAASSRSGKALAAGGTSSGNRSGRHEGGSSLNSSLRGNARTSPLAAIMSSSASSAAAGAGAAAPLTSTPDLAAGHPAVSAAAAVVLHRLMASSSALRNQLCAVPGLVSSVLRHVHRLLDQLAVDGYLLPAVVATLLSSLLAVLCVLADSGDASTLDTNPMRSLQRKLSTTTSSNGRRFLKRYSSTASDAPYMIACSGGGQARSAGEPGPNGLGGGAGGSADATRQMLDTPYCMDVLCEAIDVTHAVVEAEERAVSARSAGGPAGTGAAGGARTASGGARRLLSGYGGGGAAAGHNQIGDVVPGTSPSKIPAAAIPLSGRSRPHIPAMGGLQWHSLPLFKLATEPGAADAWAAAVGEGPRGWGIPHGSTAAVTAGFPIHGGPAAACSLWSGSHFLDSSAAASPGVAVPRSPSKRRRCSHGTATNTTLGGSPATPLKRAAPGQIADIRRNALRALQRLVGFWAFAARSEVELADALPGLLAELDVEL
ncbi:hypothetical protein VaNZ11_013409, partial [Volvox africanus]